MKKMALVTLLGLFLLALPVRAQINLLHQFTPSNIHGSNPWGDLVSDGTHFYGMTSKLGQFNGGTIFRINSGGSEFLLLHAFAGGAADGAAPYGSLIMSGSTLYGMTYAGGDSDKGTIFKIQTDGTGFTLLHEFAGGVTDGAHPYGSLIISSSTLYGMTYAGGDNDLGTIFKIGIAGSGFTLLHEFTGSDGGEHPCGSLIISGSTLYGMTPYTIFKIRIAGTGFILLHEFDYDSESAKHGSLIISGTTLYGMTYGWKAPVNPYGEGPDDVPGTIFKIQTDGTGFTLLTRFGDGDYPYGSLIISGTTLYGMTPDYFGSRGTIFKINTDGSDFSLLHEFTWGNADDGSGPQGSLIISGSTLYGMTMNGGDSDKGTIFKIGIAGSGFTLLHKFAGVSGSDGDMPRGTPVLSGTTLYGMTSCGGGSDKGTIFKVETNGTGYTLLHEFVGGAGDGANPYGDLIISGTTLYGMTREGGDNNCGTIFKIGIDGTGFTLLHEFAGGAVDGYWPEGSLLISGSTLYGMTYLGIIFKIQTDGSGFTLLRGLSWPSGSLIQSGTTLYGMTQGWAGEYCGTVFKIETDGTGYSVLHSFANWETPHGSLIISGSTLYGMTTWGGNSSGGTIFKIGVDGTGFTLLHSFTHSFIDGRYPFGSLIISGTTLYGMTYNGGDSDLGTVFKIQTDGNGFTLPHEFAGGLDDGKNPYGSLILSGFTLYGMTYSGGKSDAGIIFSLPLSESITVTSPNGGENWNSGDVHNITWTSSGSIANVNIDYSINNGGSWSPVAANTANDGTYFWTVPASAPSAICLVRVSDTSNAATHDVSDRIFSISSPSTETVSIPNQPLGAASGLKDTSYSFSTGGSISNLGHTVQYKFDWDDGSYSDWLAEGTTGASHSWTTNGTYNVKAMARCVSDIAIESLWSDTHAITISDSGTTGYYNSPSQQKFLPEVIWAPATGGGTWMSAVQITDISGGSQVSVYYNTMAGRRGPFLLWDDSSSVAFTSVKYSNLLQTIDGLDSGAFTYYGTVGAVEFVSQDAGHVLQVTARTLNGNYSKTLPGLSLHDSNTADTTRVMIIPNLTNNSAYRSTCGMFNPTADEVTVELRLRDAANTQIGTTISKTLAGHGFTSFSPFSEAGKAYPANSYDNVVLSVQPTSGTGKVFCFGASANNSTNDPAAHIAVQNGNGHDNGPGSLQILPEAIWAAATGGGTWMSQVQIVDVTGGSVVSVYFAYGGGNRRGPFPLWTGSVAGAKVKYANILQQLGTLDNDYTYYGHVGTLEFHTQDSAHFIQVTARTLNGNCSKTFPGLNLVEAETADTNRVMLIQGIMNTNFYRSTCGFYNPTGDSVMVEFTLLDCGIELPVPFIKTFTGYDFKTFSPFEEVHRTFPEDYYDNLILRVRPTSGAGKVMCFGASANNVSNDPAAHLAVQGQ